MAYVGTAIKGTNNDRLVVGGGTYIADMAPAGSLSMAVLRSPHPNARIRGIDTAAAEAVPGVRIVVTGADILADTDPIPEAIDTRALGAQYSPWYALCVERARYVGEAVCAVVATDEETAKFAVGLIEVSYELLPVVPDASAALAQDAPLVEPGWTDNVLIRQNMVVGNLDEVFANAHGTVEGEVRSARIQASPIETRGVIASWDKHRKRTTCWSATQAPHVLRTYLAKALRTRESAVHVIQPDVGGAFGIKCPTTQEEVLVCYLSKRVGAPVRWIEDRQEHLLAAGHSRDVSCTYKASFDADGRITGLRARVVADVGAPIALAGWGMAYVTWLCIPGPYKIENLDTELLAVVTNKGPWQAYRGYGKDAASFFLDRIIEHIARAGGISSAAVRRANFIAPEEFPYTHPNGATLDSGNYAGALDKLLELIDYQNFPARQAAALAEGRYLGLGLGQELTPEGFCMPGSLYAGYEATTVRVSPGGDVTVLTGVTSPGTGNETGIAQIVADALGCRIQRIRVVQGDTESCPMGSGNYSSRSLMLGGSASHVAALTIKNQMMKVAASMLDAQDEDVVVADDVFTVAGAPDRQVTFDDVATQVYLFPHGRHMNGTDPGLDVTRSFKIGNVYHQPEVDGRFNGYPTWSNAAAAAIVEVDPATGVVSVEKFALVHDCGPIVNPLLAEAQLHGGITQGIGATLHEFIAYDDQAQPITRSFMDYTMPTPKEAYDIALAHQSTPSPFTPLGTKGVGESGVGSPPGAITAAVENALAPLAQVQLDHLPLTPSRVWGAIQAATKANGPGNGVRGARSEIDGTVLGGAGRAGTPDGVVHADATEVN
ncbi:molybdopterin cofactor-binding domain-containing protein [Nocardia sp. R7R-8]|uniref:molybdopterin cofactor-binding domain-containing protein n=1 Tax=Nocardia sp. R7R-8 TaxID=3459304 RepID=UPI00403DD135